MSDETKVIRMGEQPITLTLKKCKLVVVDGLHKGQQIVLESANITVGSQPDNDLILKDETVSRRHFEIATAKDTYVLKDLGSTNGTYLNGIRVKEAFLNTGSVIKAGNVEIKFSPLDEKIEIFPSKKHHFGNMLGSSLEMRKTFGIIEKIAPTDITVIIEGETGTGKELATEAIHRFSKRASKPLIVVDCSAVAENLIESELFGHEKGAFTNAISQRRGAFEIADGGTVFLDEIGELSIELQPKLLRALESRTIKRVGGDRHIPINVRVVAATNRSLEKEVREGRFREDLYYRLAVVQLFLPPLRKRREDLPLIIQHFIDTYNKRISEGGRKIFGVEESCMEALKRYGWPGNVRELKNVIDRAITFCQTDRLRVADLPENIIVGSSPMAHAAQHLSYSAVDDEERPSSNGNASGGDALPFAPPSSFNAADAADADLPFKEAKDKLLEIWEKEYLVKLLRKNDNNISKAAKDAGIDRKSIQRMLKKYNLQAKDL